MILKLGEQHFELIYHAYLATESLHYYFTD